MILFRENLPDNELSTKRWWGGEERGEREKGRKKHGVEIFIWRECYLLGVSYCSLLCYHILIFCVADMLI